MLRRFAKAAALVAATLLAASCMESAGPRNVERQPGVPLFSYSANGITLDQSNGSFNESGTLIIKGFNPTSPHNGDAVIATFYWLGSTNIIDSVADILTTSPYTFIPGNPYHLVQYVTAGGLSMATYVATNIQGFPDAGPDPVYAVGAWLNQSVTDGGVRLSAWSGVEDVFTQAIGTGAGAPRSASGTGTVPTVASAGAIAYNAGALVHGASAAIPPVGVDRDPAFVDMNVLSDASIVDDAVYSVPGSSGTANPQWTWYFNGGGTWLVTSLTLNAAPPPPAAADSARITGAYVAGKPHSPVVTGFSTNYLCEYHTSVYNAAPGAVATVIWNTGFQDAVVPSDVLHLETPHDGSTWTYKIRVTAAGRSDVYSPDLNVTGFLTGAYPRC